jgi:hypothetical protein
MGKLIIDYTRSTDGYSWRISDGGASLCHGWTRGEKADAERSATRTASKLEMLRRGDRAFNVTIIAETERAKKGGK